MGGSPLPTRKGWRPPYAILYAQHMTQAHEYIGKFEYGDLVAWTCLYHDDDGTKRQSYANGFIDSYYGQISGEPHWIINRNGAMHHVPERLIRLT